MGRRLRFVPAGSLVEVTCRCVQGRYLLRPTPGLREIVVGILGRAQQRYPVVIHAFAFLSGHYHLLLTVADAGQLASFMCFLNTNLSKEAGRLHDWEGPMFERRYQGIVVTPEEAAQVARLRYVLDNGCKEGLVGRPADWPGAHAADALVTGEAVEGVWYDRSQEGVARRRRQGRVAGAHVTRYRLELEPIPCWSHLPAQEARERVAELVRQIEEETAERHRGEGTRPAGVAAVLRVHPHQRPKEPAWSPAPLVHAATRQARKAFWRAYVAFYRAFKEAAEKLRAGDRSACFPEGSFPPAIPFGSPEPRPG